MPIEEIMSQDCIRQELARQEIEKQQLNFDDFVAENGHCEFYTGEELLQWLRY
jgi:hypothetical protein